MKRNFAITLVALAIVAGGAVGWGITRINHHDKPSSAGTKTRDVVTTAPTRIVDYITKAHPEGVDVNKPTMVNQLTDSSPEFKQFVANTVQGMIDRHQCPTAALGLTIARYATNGYAFGAVNECGGYIAIWGVKNGTWKLLIGTQDIVHCQELHKDGVPKGLLFDGKCYNEITRKVVQYAG